MPHAGLLLLMALPFAVGGLVLVARGSRPRDLLRLRVHGAGLLWAAAAVQALRIADPGWAAPLLSAAGDRGVAVATWTLGAAFVAVNARRNPGAARAAFVLLGVGFSLNTLVTVVNDGMPYSVPAGRAAGMTQAALAAGSPGHVPAGTRTRLVVLADVLPVPGARAVASVGDLAMLAGTAWVVVALVAPERRPVAPAAVLPSPPDEPPAPAPVPDPTGQGRR